MKLVFQANDGTIFDTHAECQRYEAESTLYGFVESNCLGEYNDDAGFSVIEVQNVVDFVENHYVKIGEILGKSKKTEGDGGWIINTQTVPYFPYTLSEADVIEVVLSDGCTHTAIAGAWDESWNTNDKYRHIVKYRKLK